MGSQSKLNRHAAYIAHPEADGYSKYLLTLLSQRRELQTEEVKQILLGDSSSLPTAMFYSNPTTLTIARERQDLQKELSLCLEVNQPCSSSIMLKEMMQDAGFPLAGLSEGPAMLWHFKGRLAALRCERRALLHHQAQLQHQHHEHVVRASLPAQVVHVPVERYQLDHAGLAPQSSCTCQVEMELAMQCMQVLQAAEADAAMRVARLQGCRDVQDDDWWAVLHHVASRAPTDRLVQRLLDRLKLLPLSHQHRFPIYEEVAGGSLQRDQQMAAAQLRVPARFLRSGGEAIQMLVQLFQDFEDDVQAAAQNAPFAAGAGVTAAGAAGAAAAGDHADDASCMGCIAGVIDSLGDEPPPGTASSAQLGSTLQAAGAAATVTAASGLSSAQCAVKSSHGAVYIARRLLSKVLKRQQALWPGAGTTINLHPENSSHGADVKQKALAFAAEQLGQPPASGHGTAAADQVQVIKAGGAGLDSLVPSMLGDESAGHVAVVRSLNQPIDEALRTENSFLDVCDYDEVTSRLKHLAEAHAIRVADSADSTINKEGRAAAAMSVANQDDGSNSLGDNTLEALYYMRFLKTKRNKLKVLHYINAMVSMQATLLEDEAFEAELYDVATSTIAPKPFTCPLKYANASTAASKPAAGSTGGASGSHAADGGRPPAANAAADAHGKAAAYATPHVVMHIFQSPSKSTVGGSGSEGQASTADRRQEHLYHHQQASARGAGLAETDMWCEDQDCGVSVQRRNGRRVVYQEALGLFRSVEEELLKLASYHMEQYANQLHAAGRADEIVELDRLAVLEDLWTFQAHFCAARHGALLAYFQAYRHAESWGVEDLWGGLSASVKPFVPGQVDSWGHVAANSQQPQQVAARQVLRRELIDLCFRRPNISIEDGYFAGRYISATVSLELEANLVNTLTAAVAKQSRQALAVMHASAMTAAAAAAAMAKPPSQHAAPLGWRPGYPAALVYGGIVGKQQRGLMQEGACLPSVGAAAAALPAAVRQVVAALAEVHQVRHYVELSEMRRTMLRYACIELNMLLREEAFRSHSMLEKLPKDSRLLGIMGQTAAAADAVTMASINWLCTSHVSDSPLMVAAVAASTACPPRSAVEAFLNKEELIRQLYRSEVMWLVYSSQSRALGKRMVAPELQGIDWDNLDQQGLPLKPELLREAVQECEPSDPEPPGAAGPSSMSSLSSTNTAISTPHMASGATKGLMVAVGSCGLLGGVWRSPPLALAEFSTQPAEALQVHSLTGLQQLLTPGSITMEALRAAVKAQMLRVASLDISIRHNQILLDFIIRKLERRRRVLMWRAAAVDGITDDSALDLVIGGPPGHYSPASHPVTNHLDSELAQPSQPALLRDPPLNKIQQYQHHSRITLSMSPGHTAAAQRQPAEELLDAKALADIRSCRRQLTEIAAAMWLDISAIKLQLRAEARCNFVENVRIAASQRRSTAASGFSMRCSKVSGAVQELDLMKLEGFDTYVRGFVEALQPAAAKADLAAAARELSLLVLGSTGGYGHDWGVKITPDGTRLVKRPEYAPFFDAPNGADKLQQLLLEYGPLWQSINFAAADKAGDPDPMTWSPGISAIPPGLMFADLNGNARLDQMWELPRQWDVLSVSCYPPELLLEALQQGLQLTRLLVAVVKATLWQAALLAPSCHMACGGDVSRNATDAANSPGSHLNPEPLHGTALYHHIAAKVQARLAPLLPGALMAPSLVQLHGKMQYLVQASGYVQGKITAAPQASRLVPCQAAIAYLRQEVELHLLLQMVAITRTRDALSAAGPAKKHNWVLAGAMEYAVAHGAASPSDSLSVMQASAMRMPDADRVALHNEAARIQILLERVLEACSIKQAVQPLEAHELQLYVLTGMWTHDRLRDAFTWRALLMESPEHYPYQPARESHYMRRYHAPVLCDGTAPAPEGALPRLHGLYTSQVASQAERLLSEAAASSKSTTAAEEESVVMDVPGRSATGEGKPGWLAQSPAWASTEARSMEAATVIMRQQLDLQAIQVCLLRLHRDCAEMTGAKAAVLEQCKHSAPQHTDLWQTGHGSNPASYSSSSPAAAAARLLPAMQSLGRKLLGGKRRVAHAPGTAATYEINEDELLRWLVEAFSVMSGEARSAVASLGAAAAEERQAQHTLALELEEQVSGLAVDLDVFMRRHAIKVETQVVDQAMALLMELQQARRAALRSLEDAKRAMEVAYLEAQAQFSSRIDELNNALLVSQTNARAMKADMQKAALDALIEVRREALQKAFSGSLMNQRAGSEVNRMLALEEELQAVQREVLDMERAILKVQTWFKMRSSAFQTACMQEVLQARQAVQAMEAAMWQAHEQNELTMEQLTTQLQATQADLELVSASLAKNSSELQHALASNKRLIQWKVTMQPRMEALRTRLSELTDKREALLSWYGRQQVLMRQAQPVPHVAVPLSVLPAAECGSRALAGGSSLKLERPAPYRRSTVAETAVGTVRGSWAAAEDVHVAVNKSWDATASWHSSHSDNSTTMQLAKDEENSRAASSHGGIVQAPLLQAGRTGASAGADRATALSSGMPRGAAAGPSAAGAAGVQLEVLARRYDSLRQAHDAVTEERDALQRTLIALRLVAPELVETLDFDAPLVSQSKTLPEGRMLGTVGPRGPLAVALSRDVAASVTPSGSPTFTDVRSALSSAQQAATAHGLKPSTTSRAPAAAAAAVLAGGTAGAQLRPTSPRSEVVTLKAPQPEGLMAQGSRAQLLTRTNSPRS